ncbi:MAG: hypothetical protein LUQ14_01105 [Methanomassiliicoccales archaeon]|nr:hypothetical protein [Methanomassiliicoccales archaeon]
MAPVESRAQRERDATVSNPRIPSEIFDFFTHEGGHSLIVRGNAGTGKTTFALQIIEDISAIERSFYLSTRVSDVSLFAQFPWLKGKIERGEASSRPLISETVAGGEGHGRRRTELSNLRGLGETSESQDGLMSVSIGRDLGELEAVYDTLGKNLPAKSLIVFDSIDALAEKYGETCARLILTVQSDIVEGYGANVLFVLESADPQLDYLGDGVLVLKSTDYQGRRIREMEISKLRGCEIGQPKYLFTLKGGKVTSFGHDFSEEFSSSNAWSPIKDPSDRVSWGIKDLDRLLLDGLEKGSIVLMEIGYGVPATVSSAIECSLVANFASLKRGVMWIPLRKASAESARNHIVRMLPKDEFDRFVRIPEKATQMGTASERFVLPVEGTTALADFSWQGLAFSLRDAGMPFLSLMGFDTMESIYGNHVMDQLTDHLLSVRRNNGVFVGITSPSTSSAHRLADLATTHVKIDRIGGTIILYGEKPFTECNALTFTEQEEGGGVSLTPIL